VIGASAVDSVYNIAWSFVLFWYGRLAVICLVYLLSYNFLRSILSVYSLYILCDHLSSRLPESPALRPHELEQNNPSSHRILDGLVSEADISVPILGQSARSTELCNTPSNLDTIQIDANQ
jgi:hypothetical protein